MPLVWQTKLEFPYVGTQGYWQQISGPRRRGLLQINGATAHGVLIKAIEERLGMSNGGTL